jgi:hypothetical protein
MGNEGTNVRFPTGNFRYAFAKPHFPVVSPQTAYLWVERKQIPHFHVMDRNIRWIEYRNQSGQRRRESIQSKDWDTAQRKLRGRLSARDNRTLEVVRKGEQMSFQEWVASFMENYSKPSARQKLRRQTCALSVICSGPSGRGDWLTLPRTKSSSSSGCGSNNVPE